MAIRIPHNNLSMPETTRHLIGSSRRSDESRCLVHAQQQWTDCTVDKILKKVEIEKIISTALKSILKLVKLQSLVAKRCKMWKM